MRQKPGRTTTRQPVMLIDRVSRFTMVTAAALTFVLATVILADVLSETVTGSALKESAEIVGNAIVVIVFLQAGYAVRSRAMARADFIIFLMPWPMRRVALAFGYALGAILFAAVAAANWTPALASFNASAGWLSWPARFVIVFGAALACINYILLAMLDLSRTEPSIQSEADELRGLEP